MIFKFFKKKKEEPESNILNDIFTDIEISCSVLLVEAALMDEKLEKKEERIIKNILSQNFKLEEDKVGRLFKKAQDICKNSNDLVQHTKIIKNNWDLEKRVKFLEMMWKVALIDEDLDSYEDMIIRRVAGLIYVSDKDRSKARKNAKKSIKKEGS